MFDSKIIALLAVALFLLLPSFQAEAAPVSHLESVAEVGDFGGAPTAISSWWQALTAFFFGQTDEDPVESTTRSPLRVVARDTARLEPGGLPLGPPDGSGGSTSQTTGSGSSGTL